MSKKENLDAVINKLGYNILKSISETRGPERSGLKAHIDKALGVLVNDGVYAYYVFCKSKDKDKDNKIYSKIFVNDIIKELKEYVNLKDEKLKDINYSDREGRNEAFFQNLSENLHELLFFREALETVLIYARYHVKALGDENE
ncbi:MULTISPECIES: hypothetical protein [Tepidanaerobacter]|uniref:CRISPR type III-B/RAMP module-associated protein Cmr5 n=1 Tax=Tepidanaerobacter syntrophicus TaxID=224999 RepID=A0A0U9HKZ9_9FIRM|nr:MULTISPECIES: hypothetical protein [Tepidanaerobacter]GAQ24751.1 hypothetical protein TSYNT_6131 [Tepidanaerobacter syntrophicus]GLI51153.1 hypothetical protein TSYNTROOL_12390 [Tepidanaerobacter syntrophicus]